MTVAADRSGDPARAFWTVGAHRGELREEALPSVGDSDVLVETHYSGISRGTESLVWRGAVPASQYQSMRAPFQEGEFPFPVKYGYSAVGRVVEGPSNLAGRMVFCLHPHQTVFVAPATRVVPLPDDLPAERAVLAANMETAVNALWDAGPRIGDRIAVIGAGTVGALVARLVNAIPGTEVALVDTDTGRAALAERLGCRFVRPCDAPKDCDLVFHASGNPVGLETALAIAGVEATIVEMSWYGDLAVAVPLGEHFHSRRLTLLSSQVGMVSPTRRVRRSYADRMAMALRLLIDPVLDTLVSGESAFDALPETMARLANNGAGVLTHRIRYPAAEKGH